MKELPSLQALIDSFGKLPGVGVKSGWRMPFFRGLAMIALNLQEPFKTSAKRSIVVPFVAYTPKKRNAKFAKIPRVTKAFFAW